MARNRRRGAETNTSDNCLIRLKETAMTADPRFRTGAIAPAGASARNELFYDSITGVARRVPKEVVPLLKCCETLQNIDTHARNCLEAIKSGQSQAISSATDYAASVLPSWARGAIVALQHHMEERSKRSDRRLLARITSDLTYLAKSGLLLSEPDITERLTQIQTPTVSPNVEYVAIITCNRPEALKRCLKSFVRPDHSYSDRCRFIVIDGSNTSETQCLNQQLVRDAITQHDLPIDYMGTASRKLLADAIAARGVPREVIRYALFGGPMVPCTTGANRNHALLRTIGAAFLSFDDDTLCEPLEPSGLRPGVAVDSRFEPREFQFFRTRSEALSSLRSDPGRDVLHAFETVLSRPQSAVIRERRQDGPIDLEYMAPVYLAGNYDESETIMVAMPGLAGNSGMGSPFRLLGFDGSSFEYLTASETAYVQAIECQEVTRTVPLTTLSDSSFCMGAILGLDNRTGMVPFLPNYRVQDMFFGYVLKAIYRHSRTAYLPCTLVHAPIDARGFTRAQIRRFPGLRMATVLESLVSMAHNPKLMLPPQTALVRIGEGLIDLASCSTNAFRDLLRMQFYKAMTIRIGELSDRLRATADRPAFWAADVKAHISSLRESMMSGADLISFELPSHMHVTERVGHVQQTACSFGELLRRWPWIISAARDIYEHV